MIIKDKSKLIFVGDSVTESNRDYNAKPGSLSSLGTGYPSLIYASLTSRYPEKEIMVINKGVGGNTILHMANRWTDDVLSFNPDVVFILIGINDVWRFFDSSFIHLQTMVDEDLFTKKYQELIEITKKDGREIVLLNSFMFESNLSDPMRKLLLRYQKITQNIAKSNNLLFIDAQSKINDFLSIQSSYILSADRVHPNLAGHMLVANTILEKINIEK